MKVQIIKIQIMKVNKEAENEKDKHKPGSKTYVNIIASLS